jgi:hypothetical protein
MSDIFISYKREEQATSRKLADALESQGWIVWWDPRLRVGEIFDDVIEKALDEAKCVIVMWSRLSVQSEYVKAEATYALEHKKLVPVKIENVDLPFRFRRLHTLSLLGWDGSKDASEFRRLVEDIAPIVGPPATERQKGQPADIPDEATPALAPEQVTIREKSAAEILSNLKGITLSSQFHETVAQLYLGRWTGEPGWQATVYDLPGKRPTGLWYCGFQEVASGTLVLASTARDISTFRPGDSVTVSGRISDISRLYVSLEDAIVSLKPES